MIRKSWPLVFILKLEQQVIDLCYKLLSLLEIDVIIIHQKLAVKCLDVLNC